MITITFVRDIESGLTNTDGVLAWVENLNYPDCSELGYVFFAYDKEKKRIRRIG